MLKDGDKVIDEHARMSELLADHFYNCFNYNTYDISSLFRSILKSGADKVLNHMTSNVNAVSKTIKSPQNNCSEDLEGLLTLL